MTTTTYRTTRITNIKPPIQTVQPVAVKSKPSWNLNNYSGRSSSSDIESQQDGGGSTLYTALRPLFICMTLTGTCDHWLIKDGINRKFINKCVRIYRITTLVLFMLNFLRYCPAYVNVTEFGADLMTRLMVHIWYLLCLLNGYVCYRMVENPKRIRHLLDLWNNYQDRFGNDKENNQICSKVRTFVYISIALGWFFNVGNVVFAGYMLYSTHIFENFITPFTDSSSMAPVIKAVYLILHLVLSSTWIFTCIATITVTYTLYLALRRLAGDVDILKSLTLVEVKAKLEKLRQRHDVICEMIDVTDTIFSVYVAISVLVSMMLALMLLFNIVWYESVRSDPGQTVSHVFWLMAVLTNIVVVATSSGMINEWVRCL